MHSDRLEISSRLRVILSLFAPVSPLWLVSLCPTLAGPTSVMSAEQSQAETRTELSRQSSKTLEEQKKREAQDALVRRLQKRVLLLTKVRRAVAFLPKLLPSRSVLLAQNNQYVCSSRTAFTSHFLERLPSLAELGCV